LSDLIRQAKSADPQLGADLEREFRALTKRRSFGLVFERHQPEAVELAGRPVRKGDKVHILRPRGTTSRGDQRLWTVTGFEGRGENRAARLLEAIQGEEAESVTTPVADLVVVAEFRDHIYPGLIETGRVERGGDRPFHTVINAENFHALEMLTYTHRHSVDVIYIDPPYNTGAKDWKYNNDYVAADDDYRHSKWLAMMERRIAVSRELLHPAGSALIVTIDEKEYLRLGLLLEQIFPEARIQMVSSVINPKGAVRFNELTRTNEYIFVVMIGRPALTPEGTGEAEVVRWASLRRFEASSRRNGPQSRPDQFYPIYIGTDSGRIEYIGESIRVGVPRESVSDMAGCITHWPIKPDGEEMIWGLTPATLRHRLDAGYVRVSTSGRGSTIYYLTSGQIKAIEDGDLIVTGRDNTGAVTVESPTGRLRLPTTQWARDSHNAQSNGTGILSALLPGRTFPYPKSLYAVEDCLRLFVGSNPHAVILDFFAGSGTTAHATFRLNRRDGGERQSISITNNEVGATEQTRLRRDGYRPGDPEWESLGICDHITKPRMTAAITGATPDGDLISGDYKFTDEFPMSEGFEENVAFFTLTYEGPLSVTHHRAFARIAPMLWLRAGAHGRIISEIGDKGWDLTEVYGVLDDLDAAARFVAEVKKTPGLATAFIVTDDDLAFQMVCRDLPRGVRPVQLYESYLRNFEINSGRFA
jgi:adenine-specific DNA-methyltransferase